MHFTIVVLWRESFWSECSSCHQMSTRCTGPAQGTGKNNRFPHFLHEMGIGIDVAQTCVERHGRGWIADRIAGALGQVCLHDNVILYHQFGNWINWDVSK